MIFYFEELLGRTTPGNNPALPADYARTAEGRYRQIFFPGETVTFPIQGGRYSDQPNPTQGVASWRVLDYTGAVVRSGGALAAGVSPSITGLPLGWYRMQFSRSSGIAKWGTDAGGGTFAVVPTDKTGMRPRPSVGAVVDQIGNPQISNSNLLDPGGGLYDAGIRGMTGSAAYRMSIAQGRGGTYAPMSDSYTKVDADLALIQSNILAYDTARPKPTVINFPDTNWPDSSQAAAVAAVVQRYSTVDYFEGYNEPGMSAGLAAEYARFASMVKAGRSSAKVCGPCPVVIGTANVDANVRQFFAAGGGNSLDAVSWHQYNGVNGDLLNGRKTLDNWVAFLSEYGQQNKPRLISEAGHFFAHNYGAFTPRKQAHWTLLEMMLVEQYGIPKERYLYYYDINGGYEAQPGHQMTSTGQPFPIVPLTRVYGQELFGAPYESRLDFGTVDNNLAIGSTFRRADSTGVAVLMAAGVRTLPVVCQLPTGVTSVQVVDAWGNSTTGTVTGGILLLTLGMLPTYVRLPAGASFTVVGTSYGSNVLAGRTPTGSNPNSDIAKVTDGTYQNPYHYDWSQAEAINPAWNVWQTDATLPQTVAVPTANPVAVSAVIVHAPPPHQHLSRPLDYDVQVQQGGTWSTVATYTDSPTVQHWHSLGYDGANSHVESYDDEAHAHLIRFTRQAAVTGIRLVVRDVTVGSLPTVATSTAYGDLDNSGQPIYPGQTYVWPNGQAAPSPGERRLMLQELSAYDVAVVPTDPGAPVTPPDGTKYLVLRIA